VETRASAEKFPEIAKKERKIAQLSLFLLYGPLLPTPMRGNRLLCNLASSEILLMDNMRKSSTFNELKL